MDKAAYIQTLEHAATITGGHTELAVEFRVRTHRAHDGAQRLMDDGMVVDQKNVHDGRDATRIWALHCEFEQFPNGSRGKSDRPKAPFRF